MPSRSLAGITLAVVLLQLVPAAAALEPPDQDEWTVADFVVTLEPGLTAADLLGTLAVHIYTPRGFAFDFIVRERCGASCSADELRDIYNDLDEGQREMLINMLEGQAASIVRARLDAIPTLEVLELNVTTQRATLEQENGTGEWHPAIVVDVRGLMTVSMGDEADLAVVDTLLAMGAALRFDLALSANPGQNVTLSLASRDPNVGMGEGGRSDQVGSTQRVSIQNWKGTEARSVSKEVWISHPAVIVPTAEEVTVDVILDLSALDINVFQGLSGVTLDAVMGVRGSVVSLSTEGLVPLPPQVDLPYLSADALRVAFQDVPTARDAITAFESKLRDQMVSVVKQIGGTSGDVTGGFDDATLLPNADGPIRVDFEANVALGGDTLAGAAFTVASIPVPLDQGFPAIEGYPTAYTIILPPGIQFGESNIVGGSIVERGTDDQGRGTMTFQVTEQQARVETTADVTHSFVLREFWWLLLLAVLVFLLPILLIVLLIVRRRRRRRREADGQALSGRA